MAARQITVTTVVNEPDYEVKTRLKIPKSAEIASVEPIMAGQHIRGIRLTFKQEQRYRFLRKDGTWR